MKITYPTSTIRNARSSAEEYGHRFSGKGKRVGLSFALTCLDCHRAIVVTPAWYPWEQDIVAGVPWLMNACGGTRG